MKLLVADDHPLVRDALARTLGTLLPQAEIFEAADRPAAEAMLQAHAPVLALLDLHMPGMQGAAGVSALRLRFPAVRCWWCRVTTTRPPCAPCWPLVPWAFCPKPRPVR